MNCPHCELPCRPPSYEWDRETVDEHGDILEHVFVDRLEDYDDEIESTQQLVLVRDVFCDGGGCGLVKRQWAYVDDGRLPPKFSDGTLIPKRFRRELRSYHIPPAIQ